MKITNTNHLINAYTDFYSRPKDGTVSRTSGSEHKFDAITIQSNPRQIEERTFAESVARKLSSEVKNTASEEKLEGLRRQISSNSYTVDAAAIASRILYYR